MVPYQDGTRKFPISVSKWQMLRSSSIFTVPCICKERYFEPEKGENKRKEAM
jgi:hypothetical protein